MGNTTTTPIQVDVAQNVRHKCAGGPDSKQCTCVMYERETDGYRKKECIVNEDLEDMLDNSVRYDLTMKCSVNPNEDIDTRVYALPGEHKYIVVTSEDNEESLPFFVHDSSIELMRGIFLRTHPCENCTWRPANQRLPCGCKTLCFQCLQRLPVLACPRCDTPIRYPNQETQIKQLRMADEMLFTEDITLAGRPNFIGAVMDYLRWSVEKHEEKSFHSNLSLIDSRVYATTESYCLNRELRFCHFAINNAIVPENQIEEYDTKTLSLVVERRDDLVQAFLAKRYKDIETDVRSFYNGFRDTTIKDHNAKLERKIQWLMHTSPKFLDKMKNGEPKVLQGAAHVPLSDVCEYISIAIQKALCWYTERVVISQFFLGRTDYITWFLSSVQNIDSFILNEAIEHWQMEGGEEIGSNHYWDFEDNAVILYPSTMDDVTEDLIRDLSTLKFFEDLLPPGTEFTKAKLLEQWEERYLMQQILSAIDFINGRRKYIPRLVPDRTWVDLPETPAWNNYDAIFLWLKDRSNLAHSPSDPILRIVEMTPTHDPDVLRPTARSILPPSDSNNWIKAILDSMEVTERSNMDVVLECLFRDISGIDQNAWLFLMMKPFSNQTQLRREWRKGLWDIHGKMMKNLYEKYPRQCEDHSLLVMTTAWRVIAWHMTEINMDWIVETFHDVSGFLDEVDAKLGKATQRIAVILSLQ